ncbi:hypothetical protein C8J56DRAFT_539390 [Mycena floridula]|nr:hypothetical protein C8J56DRAFT_539390 [Mycena floridula]
MSGSVTESVKFLWLQFLLFVRAMFGQKLSPPVDIEAGHVICNPALDPIAEEIEKETILLSSMFSKAHEEEEEDDEAQGSNTPCFVEFPGPQVGKLIEPDIVHRSAIPEEGIYPETLYPLFAAKPPVTEQPEESFESKSKSNMFSSPFEAQEEDDQTDNDDDLKREAAPQLIEFQDKFLFKLMHADADKLNGHLYPTIKYPVYDTTPIPDWSTETLDTLRLELRHLFSTSILSEQDEEEAAADDEVDGDVLRSSELLKRISACFTKVIAQENQHLAQSCEVHILNAKEDEADSRPLVEMSPKSKVDQNPRHYKEPRVKRSRSIPLSTQLLKLNAAAALVDKKTTISKSLAPQESEEAVKAKKKMKPLVPRFFSPQKAQPEEKPPQPTRSWSRPLLKTFRHSGKENRVVHSPVMGSDILPSSKETGKKNSGESGNDKARKKKMKRES